MQDELRNFLARLAGSVAMTLVPVVLIAFLTMPYNLRRHPGEPPIDAGAPAAHMT